MLNSVKFYADTALCNVERTKLMRYFTVTNVNSTVRLMRHKKKLQTKCDVSEITFWSSQSQKWFAMCHEGLQIEKEMLRVSLGRQNYLCGYTLNHCSQIGGFWELKIGHSPLRGVISAPMAPQQLWCHGIVTLPGRSANLREGPGDLQSPLQASPKHLIIPITGLSNIWFTSNVS